MFPALDARQLISIKNQRKKTTPYTIKQTADQLISIFYAQDIEQQFTFLYHFFSFKINEIFVDWITITPFNVW